MNEEKILALLESMSNELKDLRSEMNRRFNEVDKRFDEVDKRFDELTLAVGDIINEVGNVMDDKLSTFAHELKWTKDATAQNSMDIAALKKRS